MLVTHRVKNGDNKTIGFLAETDEFYNQRMVKQNIHLFENMSILRNGALRCNKKLPEIRYSALMKAQYEKLKRDNPFRRDIQYELNKWKNNKNHQVLQLDGARQTGKTTELLKFAYSNYEYVIYVNLANDAYNFYNTMKEKAVNCLSMLEYCINANLPDYVNSKHTVLVIDEIQEKYQIYNMIRSFNAQLNCDVVVSGSYLGQTLKSEYFHPAGTITKLLMTPLSFREFTRIFNREDILMNIDLYGNSPDREYKALDECYNIYRQIGGYPNVVMEFIRTKSVEQCKNVLKNIISVFTDESSKYFRNSKEAMIFEYVYREAIVEMSKEKIGSGNKIVEDITKIAKNSLKTAICRDEVLNAITWLKYSKIIGICDMCVNGAMDDLKEARRMYFTDCGILNVIAEDTGIPKNNIEGLLTETFAFNELNRLFEIRYESKKVKGIRPQFSITSDNTKGELDFMIMDTDDKKYGIEVKTSKGEPTTLKLYVDKRYVYRGIVAKYTKGGRGKDFDTIPIYAVGVRFPY